MRSQLIAGDWADVARCDVQYSLGTGYAFLIQAICCSSIRYQDRACEVWVGIQFQAVLDYMGILTSSACVDHRTTMR